jgi:hypothetical protein
MTQEFIHVFKGFGRVPSQCLVKIYEDDGETYVCFIDLGEGTSVTNASEQIASEIVNEYHLSPTDCRFFETYQQYEYGGFDDFDEIEYDWKFTTKFIDNGMRPIMVWGASSPRWKPCDEEQIKELFIQL